MKHLIWFTTPTHGHTIPIIPLVKEVSSRYKIILWTTPEMAHYFAGISCILRHYPKTITWDFPNEGIKILRRTLQRANKIWDTLQEEEVLQGCDYVISDNTAIWGKALSAKKEIKTLTYSLTPIGAGPGLLNPFIGQSTREAVTQSIKSGKSEMPKIKEQMVLWRERCNYEGSYLSLFKPKTADNHVTLSSKSLCPASCMFEKESYVGPIISKERPFAQSIEKSDRKLVYVSLGTLYQKRNLYQDIINSAHGASFDVALSVSFDISKKLQNIPENVKIYSFVNQMNALEKSDLFITHGGANSIHETLYFNTAFLIVPQGADQPYICDRLVASQVSLRLLYSNSEDLTGQILLALSRREPGLFPLHEQIRKESKNSIELFISKIYSS